MKMSIHGKLPHLQSKQQARLHTLFLMVPGNEKKICKIME